MKENKYLNENEQIIEDFTTISRVDLNKSHPLVVEETDPRFVVVNEFSHEAKSAEKLEFANQEDGEENNEETLIYAEEIVEDDDDDLYEEALHDIAVQKQRHRNYLEIGKELDQALAENGFSGEFGFQLLSAMKYSRLLYMENNENLVDEIKVLSGMLGTPYFHIPYNVDGNIASNNMIFEILNFAKKNFNKPVFIFTGELDCSHVLDHLKPLYTYIDNPEGDNFVTANGKSMRIPNNIYIIYTIKDDKNFFDVSRRLLRYSARVETELTRTKTNNQIEKPFVLSLEELTASFRETCENFSVEEETWRKVDELIKAINGVNGYILKNKIQRKFEDVLLILLSSGKKIEDAIDVALSSYLLHEAVVTQNPIKYLEEVDLIGIIEDSFGTTAMKRSKNVVKKYLALFNKKGEKINE